MWDNDRLYDSDEYNDAPVHLRRKILEERTKRFGQAQKGKQKAIIRHTVRENARVTRDQRSSNQTVDFQSEDLAGRPREALEEDV